MKNKQLTLAGSGFEKYAKTTRRAQFLARMECVVPWGELCALIEPVYPKGEGGRPTVPLERMLRVYFLQHRFNRSLIMNETWRFIIVVTLLICIGGLLPFAIDASLLSFIPPAVAEGGANG